MRSLVVFTQGFPNLQVLLLSFGLARLFSSLLAQQFVKGDDLALFLDVDQLVAHLSQAIYVREAETQDLTFDSAVSKTR